MSLGGVVSVADITRGRVLGGGRWVVRGSQACRCAQGVEHLGSDEAIFLQRSFLAEISGPCLMNKKLL